MCAPDRELIVDSLVSDSTFHQRSVGIGFVPNVVDMADVEDMADVVDIADGVEMEDVVDMAYLVDVGDESLK
jgi:hypothetical protein